MIYQNKDTRVNFCYHLYDLLSLLFIFAKKRKDMNTTLPVKKNGKVQAILRMDSATYEAIRRAARRSGRSFNRYAVETLEEAVNPQEEKISIKDVQLDPELAALIIPSLDLTEEEIRNDPRMSAILGL